MPQFIRFNLIPASVTISEEGVEDIIHGTSRTIVTDDAIYVYIDSFDGPVEAFSERLDDFDGNSKIGWTALTSEGQSVSIRRSQGCACGSRLRGFDPFPGVPYRR